MTHALDRAIVEAFFLPGSAAHVALCFSTKTRKLSASDVYRIWNEAKERGDLPHLNRPRGGPRDGEAIPFSQEMIEILGGPAYGSPHH